MFQLISTLLLIVSIALGGSGITVAAAQNSLPDQALYPLKTWSEDFRSGWIRDPQAQIQFSLKLANRRADEVRLMLQAGAVPSEAAQKRLQAELEKALALTAEQPEPQAVQALLQIREQVHRQEQAFLKLGALPQEQADAVLQRTRTMLEDTLRRCDAGLADPDRLREHLRDREQDRDPVQDQDRDRQHDQDRDRDQIQDQEPIQERDRDQDHIQDPTHDSEQEREREHNTVTPTTPEATPAPTGGYGPGPGDGSGGTGGCGNCTPEPQQVGNPDPGPKPEDHGDGSGGSGGDSGGSHDDGNHHGDDGGAGGDSGKGGNH